VLNRLAADWRTADAFVAVLPNGDDWDVLISDCITASERARTHEERICALRKRLQRAPNAINAVETIADFFGGMRSEPFDPVKQALGYLRAEIDFWRRLTEESLGALSRKKDVSAARAESLGWLRESVLRLSGRPNLNHVAVLAEIVLGTRDIDPNNVRKAVKPSDALRRGRNSAAKNTVITTRKRKSVPFEAKKSIERDKEIDGHRSYHPRVFMREKLEDAKICLSHRRSVCRVRAWSYSTLRRNRLRTARRAQTRQQNRNHRRIAAPVYGKLAPRQNQREASLAGAGRRGFRG
jgi:hypothetical protein